MHVLPCAAIVPSIADVVALAALSPSASNVPHDVKSSTVGLTSSNALVTTGSFSSHMIRTSTALLFFALTRGAYSRPMSQRCDLLHLRDGGHAEFLGALLTSQGLCGRSPKALLDPWIREESERMRAYAPEEAPYLRAWSRTVIGGLITGTHRPQYSPPNAAYPTGEPFLELCLLSLSSTFEEVCRWSRRSARSTAVQECLTKWKLHVMVAAGCALRLGDLDELSPLSSSLADTSKSYLEFVSDHLGPLHEIEGELLPIRRDLRTRRRFSSIAHQALTYLIMAHAASGADSGAADGARLLAKFHDHARMVSAQDPTSPPVGLTLPTSTLHSLLRHQLSTVPSPTGLGVSHLGVQTVLGLMQRDRARFDAVAAVATTTKFELAAVHPKLAGDPAIVSWVLQSLATALETAVSQRTSGGIDQVTRLVGDVRSVSEIVHAPSMVAACVPPGGALEVVMEAVVQEERRGVVMGLLSSVACASSMVIRSVSQGPKNALGLMKEAEETVATVATMICALLSLWAKKSSTSSRGRPQRSVPPSWRKRMADTAAVRTHKMELLRGELPQRVIADMCWDWLRHGFTAPAVRVIGALLAGDFLDVHYFPLALLSCVRCAVRLEPSLLENADTVRHLSRVLHQRFSLFNEQYVPPHPSVGSALIVVDNNKAEEAEALVYPQLHRIKERMVIGPMGTPSFLSLSFQGGSSQGYSQQPEAPLRRSTVAWKKTSSAQVM